MPELPEVETVVRTLRPFLLDRTIGGLDVYWNRTVDPHDPTCLESALLDRRIVDVQRRAKLIVFILDDSCRLTVHLRMTGELLFLGPKNSPQRSVNAENKGSHLRASLKLDQGCTLEFYDIRKFGRIRLYHVNEWDELDRELGIEPLSPGFTPECLADILGGHCRQMKPLLLDQSVIAGLGNIYVDEALFKARIHPMQASELVSRRKAFRLHESIQEILRAAIDARGTTLRNYRTGTGESGENQERLRIYGKKPGSPCPRCGRPIRRIVVGQRGTVYCSYCQRLSHRPGRQSR